MSHDSAYEVLWLFLVVPCMWVCVLLRFVTMDGCEHENNNTTASSDPGFAQ